MLHPCPARTNNRLRPPPLPSYNQLKRAADQAYDELVRRHPDLYHRIRTALTHTKPATGASNGTLRELT